MMKINNEMPTKAICNKGFSGNSCILPRLNFVSVDRKEAHNPLLHIASDEVLRLCAFRVATFVFFFIKLYFCKKYNLKQWLNTQ